jgi:hypothetical protein
MLFYFFLCTISMLIKSVIYGFYYILKVNSIFYRCPWLSSVGHWLMRFINSLIHGYTRLLICLHVWFASSKLFCLFSHLGGCNFLHILASCLWSRTCRPYNNSYSLQFVDTPHDCCKSVWDFNYRDFHTFICLEKIYLLTLTL